jgi:hypothetical protein
VWEFLRANRGAGLVLTRVFYQYAALAFHSFKYLLFIVKRRMLKRTPPNLS